VYPALQLQFDTEELLAGASEKFGQAIHVEFNAAPTLSEYVPVGQPMQVEKFSAP
jgi:hypothetical protein